MNKELIKIKCINCSEKTFEFSYSLLNESKKIRFTCNNCGDWTTVELTKSGTVTVRSGD